MHGLFLTISAQRPKPSDEAELRFLETPAGQPAAVKTWWYPGNSMGREFIYPKSQARRLAQETNQTVLTTKAESVTNDQMKSADLSYVTPSGRETPLTDEQLVDAAANTPPVGTSSRRQYDGRPRSSARRHDGGEYVELDLSLLRTSTAFPMVGLLGLMSLRGRCSASVPAVTCELTQSGMGEKGQEGVCSPPRIPLCIHT